MKITVGAHLLNRLNELGIHHIFGVPGDYNLTFLDQILSHPKLEWVGNCNELNGAYASDGYARIKGASALVTTFGVGELSAINGIAGAYAEYAPVVNIVGMPALTVQARKAIVHHTLGGGDFDVFVDMFRQVTCAQTVLTPLNAIKEIDRVLIECWLKKRPVYIGIPTDVSHEEISPPEAKLKLVYPSSNVDAVNEAVERIAKILEKSKNPIILADICASRHPMSKLIVDLLNKTGIPFATMNMGKSIINESHPQFIGNYNGDLSAPHVQKRVEESDCIISFGTIMSDFNTGGFTSRLDVNATVEIHSSYVKLKHSIYHDLYFDDVIKALIKRLATTKHHEKYLKQPSLTYQAENKPLTQERFWHRMSKFIQENNIIIPETGTSLFGLLQTPMPDHIAFVGQPLWASIGYAVGATLGTCLADRDRQTILFVGDGSFQLTAQEVSTMIRHRLTPIIFLINNDGYTVERLIHGANETYNDIQMWKYAELPKIFGENVWTKKISTEIQLEETLSDIKNHRNKLIFIELIMNKDDSPELLKKVGEACAKQNQG